MDGDVARFRSGHRPGSQHDFSPTWRAFAPSWPLIVGIAVFALLHRQVSLLADPDTYLHIAAGHWMMEFHRLPVHDPFSHSMAGAAWIPHEWLSQVILAAVYDRLGWGGLILLGAGCLALSLTILTRRLLVWCEPISALILVAICEILLLGHVLVRPHVLAFPLLVLWCGEMIAARDSGRAPRWWVLPVMPLWSNLHGSSMFGLALALAMGIEATLSPIGATPRRLEAKRWALFVGIAAATATINPNGIAGLIEPFRFLQMPVLHASFIEWMSPNFQDFQPLEIWLLAAIFVGFASGMTLPWTRVVLLLGLFHLSLAHVRHGDLLAFTAPLLLAAPLGPQFAAKIRQEPPSLIARGFAAWVKAPGSAALALALVVVVCLCAHTLASPIARKDDASTPAAALKAAQDLGLEGPVFNNEGFGGYLIFKGVPTVIDGRIEMYGDAFLKRYLEALAGREPEFQGMLDQYHIDWTLLAPKDGAVVALDLMPGWRRVYTDANAVVHRRVLPP